MTGVSESEFDAAAQETYRAAAAQLLQNDSQEVRTAVANMSDPQRRDAAMQRLWTIAASDDVDEETRTAIYRLCGAVGETNGDPLGQRALEVVASAEPNNENAWRMLSRSYSRTNRTSAAVAAAQVVEGVQQQQAGNTEQAERTLERAVRSLPSAGVRAAVTSELGAIAEQRNDWSEAASRRREAYELREQEAEDAPAPVAQARLQIESNQLARALDRSGQLEEACRRLRAAQEEHDVEAEDEELAARCAREYSVTLQPRTVIRRPLQTTVTPQRTTTATPSEK